MNAPAPSVWPWQAARQRLSAWWLARLPLTDRFTLTQNRVYILPTPAGWALAGTLLLLLLVSINYQLNLGYLFTFLLSGCVAAGVVVAHNTLRGLDLQLLPPAPLFLGGQAQLGVRLHNPSGRPRYAIGLALRDTRHWAWADVPAQGQSDVHIGFSPARRGLQAVPVLTAQTLFPLGAFRVWTIWRPASPVLVYPRPEVPAPALPPGEPVAGQGIAAGVRASGEFDGVRGYQPGDPLKLVVWKKFAKSGELVSRDTLHAQRQELWLDYARTGLAEPEARLSRLTAWVLAADSLGLDYGLRLPGQQVPLGNGPAHRLRCLEALALC